MNLWLVVPAKPFDEGKSRLADTLNPSERAAVNQNLLTQLLTTTNSANIFTGTIVISRSEQVLDHARSHNALPLLEEKQTAPQVGPFHAPTTMVQAESSQAEETPNYPCCAATFARPHYAHTVEQSHRNVESATAEAGQNRRSSLPKEDRLNRALAQATQAALACGAGAILVLPTDLPLITVNDVNELYRLGAAQKGVVLSRSQDGGTNALLLRPPHAIDFAFGINSFQQHYAATIAAGYPCQILESPTLAFDLDGPEDWVRWQESNQDAHIRPLVS